MTDRRTLKLVIGGREETEDHLEKEKSSCSPNFTHLFCALDAKVKNRPEDKDTPPSDLWLASKAKKRFWNFDDINHEISMYKAVTKEQVQEMVEAFKEVNKDLDEQDCRVLINCHAGISRSTAMAYVLLCVVLGPGKEKEALRWVREVRREAFPNSLIVKYADDILGRNGEMIKANERFCDNIRRENRMYGW